MLFSIISLNTIVRAKKIKNNIVEDNLKGFFKSAKQEEQSFIHKGQQSISKLPIIKKYTRPLNKSIIPYTNAKDPTKNVI